VTAVPGSALSGNLVARWSALQLADPELASPFFRPEFTQAVARVRDGVFVAVVEDGRVPVGFLPFERARLGIGKPVGRHLSDYQGAVMQEGADWDPACVVRACRLQAWDFDHLLASQREFIPFHVRGTASPQLDLARGFEAYCSDHRASGSRAIPKTRAKERRLEREHGALRFSAQSADVGALRELVRLKSAQYRNSGVRDVFAAPWPVELLEALVATRSPAFAGMLSTLHADDRLVAAHMGMRSRDAWHHWFPAYDPDFARYSPGLILLLHMAEAAEGMGLRLIDFGKGDEEWKLAFMTGAVPLARGSVVVSGALARGRRLAGRLKSGLDRSPLGEHARRVRATLRRRAQGF
jgi:CelD/BcsL family acetyltransferase involved in cellulose biosynthesis